MNFLKVSFQQNIIPEVSAEAKENSRNWDLTQTRAYVDPTRKFWLNKDPRVKYAISVQFSFAF